MPYRLRTYCSNLAWRAIRVLQRTGLIKKMSFVMRARINGRLVRIPVIRGVGASGLVNGEPWASSIFAVLLDRFPGTFVDAGVNVGQTLVRIRTLSDTVPYVGFEPNPNCVSYLKQLIRINGYSGVPVLPVGLSDADGGATLTMNNDSVSDEGASIVRDFRPGHAEHHRFAVEVVRFETAEQRTAIGKLGIVKIDVEGSEREVLRSMAARIRSDRPAVVLEILPVGRSGSADRLQRQEDIEALFAAMSYRMLRIHHIEGGMRLEPMTAPIGIHDDQRLANFIVVPAERETELFPLLDHAVRQHP